MKQKRVLVFDDDRDILYSVELGLTQLGWEVFTSTHCKDVVRKVLEVSPSVILMDLNFPEENELNGSQLIKPFFDKNGVKVTQLLTSHPETRHIPVVLFSAENDIAGFARQAGTSLFIRKPFAMAELEKILSQACSEGASV